MTRFEKFLQDVAGSLGIPGAAQEAMAFMCRSGISPAERRQNVYSDVAPGAFPIEISFSQTNPAELRLLIEPCTPGEGILARTVMGIAAVGNVAEIFSAEVARHAQDLVRRLLPDGENVAHLNWRSSVWLALRTTGEQSALRVYVNGQFSNARERWRRMGEAFAACGLAEASVALERLRLSAGDLLEPVGLCFDVGSGGLAPARVHGVTQKISPYWLLRLLQATGNEAGSTEAADFLDLFGLLERRGACPILVSAGLEQDGFGSIKIDVDLPNLEPDIEARRKARYLAKAEARFGEIAGYHAARWTLDGADPRYIGMTIRSSARFLNVYFPGAPIRNRSELPPTDRAFGRARAFVHTQVGNAGALAMDARAPGIARAVPEQWPDVYMTCLLIQEHSPTLCSGGKALQRARSWVRSAREGWSWRYLPDLPPDLDDTAMAWAALEPADRGICAEVLCQVRALANPDGGFRTFIGEGGKNQPSHPAVTLNVAFALEEADLPWERAATDRYLERWLWQPDFPACPWMGSPLFPIYLFARSARILERLGPAAAERLASRVAELRRVDGTWGGELPDSLSSALAVVALDRLKSTVSGGADLARFFLQSQFDDGGWGWSPLYSDGRGTWFGHRAITTLFVIRAMEILQYAKGNT